MNDRRELWGWILFLVPPCFLVAAIRDRDLLLGLASLAFLLACVLFIRAHLRR